MCACILCFPCSVPSDGCRSHLSVNSEFKMLLMSVEDPGKGETGGPANLATHMKCIYVRA